MLFYYIPFNRAWVAFLFLVLQLNTELFQITRERKNNWRDKKIIVCLEFSVLMFHLVIKF